MDEIWLLGVATINRGLSLSAHASESDLLDDLIERYAEDYLGTDEVEPGSIVAALEGEGFTIYIDRQRMPRTA